MHRLSAVLFFLAVACAAPEDKAARPAGRAAAEAAAPMRWQLPAFAASIRAGSCPAEDPAPQAFMPLELAVTPLNEASAAAVEARMPEGTAFAGGWQLSSPDPNFGGLSGLAVIDAATLLAVTDAGGWVRIGLRDGAPFEAAIGYMRSAEGATLSGKAESDAEGLAYRDGIALVSFERDFRIEAFALDACGVAARAVRVASLPAKYSGITVDANRGPEALVLQSDGSLRFVYEDAGGGVSPVGDVSADGSGAWTRRTAGNPDGFAVVAADVRPGADDFVDAVQLFRAFDPLRGARSVLRWGPGSEAELTLSRPLLTDNFEGLAIQPLEAGRIRLWIVSDDNFSPAQRTLIYAFDVRP